MQKNKTPDYTLNAVKAYRGRKDFVSVSLPAGAKEEFKNLGVPSPALLGRELLSDKLEQLKNPDMVYFTIGLNKPLADRLTALGLAVTEHAPIAFEQYAEMWEDIERQDAEEQQEIPLERPQEAQEEDKTKTVKESPKDDGKPAKKRDNAVVLAELQATVDRKRQKQEERKQKLEQEKEKRKEEEREQNRLEMRRYAENIRNRAKENQEQKEIVKQFMDDPFLRENVLKPERREDVVEVVGQKTYDAIVKADKERRREETKQRERMREIEAEPDQGEVPDFMDGL